MPKSTKQPAPAAAAPETVAGAFLSLLRARGIDWLFANAGTDFAPVIEALVQARKVGIPVPEAVPIAHETTAVAMAHGYWLVTGRPQAVMVHVNVGTANALMGLVNASRDHVPMLFMSGRTPLTEQGRHGSRDLPIHWGQEMFDQAGMLRELVKFDYELRYPEQVATVVDRAISAAMTEPRGPAYLSLPREALAERWTGSPEPAAPTTRPATTPAPDPGALSEVARRLAKARRPLVIAGRSDAATFDSLATFADACAVPVVHFWPARMALSTEHPMHAGFDPSPWIERADFVLVLDVMVPWLPARHRLADGATVVHVGPDPAFHRIPMRSFPGEAFIRAGVPETLRQLGAAIEGSSGLAARRRTLGAEIAALRKEREGSFASVPRPMTNAWVSRVLSRCAGDDAIVFGELGADPSAMRLTHANAWFGHPIAGGLGWGVPAALGAKLALPHATVVACVGDGSYLFANPVASHQTAAALDLPILTIVFNNGVWNAVRKSTRALYPSGHAAGSNDMPLSSLAPSPDYERVVEASGGWGRRVDEPEALPEAIGAALRVVREERRQALLNVIVAA
ncbi:MAG: thiamine pyrophosphate-requiring protein [Hyphomicrobiaceae bacterium]|nr:thiamine pyrophosphate-requiring protein [Hyphomicrobiaceae bacterium]